MQKILNTTLLTIFFISLINAQDCTKNSDCKPNENCHKGKCKKSNIINTDDYAEIKPELKERVVGSQPVIVTNEKTLKDNN